MQDTGLGWGPARKHGHLGPASRELAYSLVGGRGGNWALQWRREEHEGGRPPQTWEESRKKWHLKTNPIKPLV